MQLRLKYVADITKVLNAQNGELTEVQNLILNLLSGMPQEYLTPDEKQRLIESGLVENE